MKKLVPIVVLLLGAAYLLAGLFPPRPKAGEFDLDAFGRLPVLLNGRLKPLDTVGRTMLLILQGRQRVSIPENSTPLVPSPTAWLADVLFNPTKADTYPTFRIDSPEVLELMGLTESDTKINYDSGAKRTMALLGFLPTSRSRFSFSQLQPKLAVLDTQIALARKTEAPDRTAFQRSVLTLGEHVILYDRLMHSLVMPGSKDFLGEVIAFQAGLPAGVAAIRTKAAGLPFDAAAAQATLDAGEIFGTMAEKGYMLAIPPPPGDPNPAHWRNAGTALLDSVTAPPDEFIARNLAVIYYAGLARAWNSGDSAKFNQGVTQYRAALEKDFAAGLAKTATETRFNAADTFYRGMILYLCAFLLGVFSWLLWPDALRRAAFWLVLLAWVTTTAGILTRMWLEGRPPVTNLYSSALFIGWGAVLLCLVLERIFRIGIGSVAAGLIGFATLIIAHFLSLSGDTLEMMQAVLDSNFWLATHVVIVTTGYASTFLAGFLALIYVCLGLFTPWLNRDPRDMDTAAVYAVGGLPAVIAKPQSETIARMMEKMIYGIVCFATLFSFVGTVLGGIWADQSWGRFWGWDPKENGALIIVLWNVLILHARWGGLVKQRGLIALAIFGNIVTAWSWFGVNMLGVGLHSYGFMDSALFWLLAFDVAMLGFILLATLPFIPWRSGPSSARSAG